MRKEGWRIWEPLSWRNGSEGNVGLRAGRPDAKLTTMNMSAIQRELLSLPPEQQDMLSAFLVSVRLKRDGLLKVVDDRLNDTDPGNWVAWDDLKPELGDS